SKADSAGSYKARATALLERRLQPSLRLPGAQTLECPPQTSFRVADSQRISSPFAKDLRPEAVSLNPQRVDDLAGDLVDYLHHRVLKPFGRHCRQPCDRLAAVVVELVDRQRPAFELVAGEQLPALHRDLSGRLVKADQ